jgi:adenylate cyclase
MQAGTKKRLSGFLARTCAIGILGGLFGAAVGAGSIEPAGTGAALGALSGIIEFTALAVLIGGPETFLPRTRLGKALDRLPFLLAFGLKAMTYSLVIVLVVGGRLGKETLRVFIDEDFARVIDGQVQANIPIAMLMPAAFLVTSLLLLLHQLGLLVGYRTLRNIVFGRYRRARTDSRFFLFVDIVGSTALAERVGPAAVNQFLDRVFQAASDPIDDHDGEVYQYVGDEMVITWSAFEGRPSDRPLACYFAIEEALANLGGEFERDFGVAPRLRGALHAGTVITGEVGGSRRAIVFHGDVMNTASRLENATRDLNRPFLCSADALSRTEVPAGYQLEDLGLQQLRGREAPLRVYSISRP